MFGSNQTTSRVRNDCLILNADFISTNRDDAVELRKELWFLKFECRMQWNKVILTDDAIVKYYENVMGLIAESREPEKSFYDIKRAL